MRAPSFPIAVLISIAALVCWTQASAQEVPHRRPLASMPKPAAAPGLPAMAAGSKVTRSIELPLNKAKMITLARPLSRIVMGDETVAYVHFEPEQPTKVFILTQDTIGSTNVFLLDEQGAIIEQIEVTVIFDHDGIKDALKRLLPDEEIDVSVFRDSVFLTGKVHSASAAANAVNIARQFVAEDTDIVNMMTVIGGQQVILLVRVAEMSRDVRKNLAAETFLSKRFRPLGGRGFDIQGTRQPPVLTAFAAGTLFTGTNILGNPTIEALERQNLVKTLAEPTLTAVSGETASFLSGGEFPFPSGLDENGQTIFEFREFGIRLNFSPIVLEENRINLQISTEISALGDVVNGQQSLTQKRTETTIEIPSGGSLMISGLLKDDMTDTVSGFPYLKDVPVLGALFRSTEFQQQQSELVVTVTAYLAKPADAGSIALPTDGFEPASDVDIYLLGRLQHRYGRDSKASWFDTLKGPFGYIMK